MNTPENDLDLTLRHGLGAPAIVAVATVLAACQQSGSLRSTSPAECVYASASCVTVILPPKLVEAGGLRRVAIASGSGSGASQMATQLESRLSVVTIDDRPFYTLVRPGDSTREATFELSTTTWSVADSRQTQERSRCNDKACKNPTTYNVSCTVRTANVGAIIRLRGRDGREMATRDARETAVSEACQGDSVSLPAPEQMLSEASARVVARFQESLAVTKVLRRVRLMDDTAGIADRERVQRFAMGIEFHKAGRLDRSCPIFEELTEVETRSVAVFYNAAFCAQAAGDWRRAFHLYSKSDANANKPLPQLKDALEETRPYEARKGRF